MSTGPKFLFKNFEAGPNLEHFANDGLEQVMRLAPYNTKVDAAIEIVENVFHVLVKIHMGNNPATINFKDADITKLLQRTFGKMRSDISRWRRDRALKVNRKHASEFEQLQLSRKQRLFSEGKKDDDDD